ncbi:hypothetical protein ccbrp13_37630 [Ktedonobacteria bacterium brp13]|nr:hypothetical protein ccbrp13_37630 [Ktedonobacteria bacterium brp13]
MDIWNTKDVPLETFSHSHSTPYQGSRNGKSLRWKSHLLGTTAKKSPDDTQYAWKATEK